ncbi:hypothetical protein CC85DRAFT_270056 [Cutaneotrichosporon oleaginosum]|uniref:NADH2 dehydrogenase n=1 Tax=Cutaneotrichosporon oleaginosum TaxID=879819 RepID=A0A0J0XVE0_9TREE|nr:uncharacterized protein CC85DRAFT_270056 [Cutaneotrichosporon oleaginosum]KLT45032.1 hypothetical protein CC85DRAFT_270056 [Cutaneotrichosporon oleaginosum]TXT09719.1 hypothetical protein COLE_03653 [Cutaneotrichosporon oleaginosum]
MLRATRPLFYAAQALKETTNITGLAVHPRPLPALKSLYTETLTGLAALPASSVYRQATEALTKHRMAIVERAGEDVAAVERELGTMVEVAIQEAECEKKLVGSMGEWKAWESLEEKPEPNQWRYFDPTGDSL